MIDELKAALNSFIKILPEPSSVLIELPNDVELTFHRSSSVNKEKSNGEFILLNSRTNPEDVNFFNENVVESTINQLISWNKLENKEDIKLAIIKINEKTIEKF